MNSLNNDKIVEIHKLKRIVSSAIKAKRTLKTGHIFSEVLNEIICLEVYPFKLDEDFLICFDLEADQPYVINLKMVVSMTYGENRSVKIPEKYKMM